MRGIGGDPSKEGTGIDRKKNAEGHERIFGSKKKAKSGTYHMVKDTEHPDGHLVHEDDLTEDHRRQLKAGTRKRDTDDIQSEAMGCAPSQVGHFNRELSKAGISGAKFDPGGTLHMKGRKTKLDVMKARGLHDRDEVRG